MPDRLGEESHGGRPAPPTDFGHANDFLPAERRDPTVFAGDRTSCERAFLMAGIGLADVDFAEVHECFTIAEVLMYEAMGLTKPGKGSRAIEEGRVYKDGRLPVNVSG